MGKNKKYRLYWKSKATGQTGQGIAEGEKIAQIWVERMNAEFPNLEHWYEPAPEPEAAGQKA